MSQARIGQQSKKVVNRVTSDIDKSKERGTTTKSQFRQIGTFGISGHPNVFQPNVRLSSSSLDVYQGRPSFNRLSHADYNAPQGDGRFSVYGVGRRAQEAIFASNPMISTPPETSLAFDQAMTSAPIRNDNIQARIEALIDDLSSMVTSSSKTRFPQYQVHANGAASPSNNSKRNLQFCGGSMLDRQSTSFADVSFYLSRPMQRKLANLMKCKLVYCSDAKLRLVRSLRSIGERALTDLLMIHQNPMCLTKNLWLAVRNRGCQFLGPAMQEEVLNLILLALEDGSALSRKVLVLFVVQKLLSRYPRASKTNIGHVVQLLYRASCFKLQKRDDESSLMQLKEEFRNYDSLRREHDVQIIQIAMDACLKITPESWSALLYGDCDHRSQMQSIIDRLQLNQVHNFGGMLRELQNALQRTGDPYELGKLLPDIDFIDRHTRDNASDELGPSQDIIDQPGNIMQHTSSSMKKPHFIDDDILLAVLKRIKTVVLACAWTTKLIRQRSHNQRSPSPSQIQYQKQYHSTYNVKDESHFNMDQFTRSESPNLHVSNIPLACLEKPPDGRTKLCRMWSSMTSVRNGSELNQHIDFPEMNNDIDTQWMQYDSGDPPPVVITSADSDQLAYQASNQQPSNLDLDFHSSVNPSSMYSSESNLSICSGHVYDEDTCFNNSANWQQHYSHPNLPFVEAAKRPPRSPIRPDMIQTRDWPSKPPFYDKDMNNLRHWMSMCTIPSNWKYPEQHRSTSDLNRTDDDRKAHDREYQNLLDISNRIHDLERQKQDILSKLANGRDGPFAINNEQANFEVRDPRINTNINSIPSGDVNDSIVSIPNWHLHNKLAPICRSHRRLAQSLVAFPPLPENNDQVDGKADEDHLFEHTDKVISQVLSEDEYATETQYGRSPAILKQAKSMSAITDELASKSQGNLASQDAKCFKWTNNATSDDSLQYSVSNLCNQIDQISTTDFCKSST